jgi:competence protein ComEC
LFSQKVVDAEARHHEEDPRPAQSILGSRDQRAPRSGHFVAQPRLRNQVHQETDRPLDFVVCGSRKSPLRRNPVLFFLTSHFPLQQSDCQPYRGWQFFFYLFFISFSYSRYVTRLKKYWKVFIILFCFVSNFFVWYVARCEWPNKYLTVVFLNIGQGDAIYIESPTHTRMLIDGGPEHSLMPELRKVLPFYVRSLDTLIVTNPDADHYAGFIDALETYSVNKILEPGTNSDTSTYAVFENIIKEKNIPKILARRGMILHLGNNADLKILFPDRDVSNLSTNDGSIIAKLSYGQTSVMFTGDATSATEEYTLSLENNSEIKSTILKAGHHGSRTSASELFIQAVNPHYAVISAGLHNKYGHPHKETVDLFHKLSIPMLITYEKRTIIAKSDGELFRLETEK